MFLEKNSSIYLYISKIIEKLITMYVCNKKFIEIFRLTDHSRSESSYGNIIGNKCC